MAIAVPYLGHGVGLRPQHFPRSWDGTARVDWFEVDLRELHDSRAAARWRVLERVRAPAPDRAARRVAVDRLDRSAERDVPRRAARRWPRAFEPAWVSDHLCWGSVGGHYAHDLLPLPYTEEALAHVVGARRRACRSGSGAASWSRTSRATSTFAHSTMPEWEFLAAVAERADCGILLDVNNVYVSAVNHGFDAEAYLDGVPADRVGQIHLAGHSDHGHAPARHARRAGARRGVGALPRRRRAASAASRRWSSGTTAFPRSTTLLRRGRARARRRGRGAGGRCRRPHCVSCRSASGARSTAATPPTDAALARRGRRTGGLDAGAERIADLRRHVLRRGSVDVLREDFRARSRGARRRAFAELGRAYLDAPPSSTRRCATSDGASPTSSRRRTGDRRPGRPTWRGSSGRASTSSTRPTPSRSVWRDLASLPADAWPALALHLISACQIERADGRSTRSGPRPIPRPTHTRRPMTGASADGAAAERAPELDARADRRPRLARGLRA